MLKITNLTYKYKNFPNIYKYNLEVKEEEIIAILGQSGSGKSTLLDLIAGFNQQIDGDIFLKKKKLSNLSIEKRKISILFQNNNLFEHLSVQKNIILGIKNYKSEDIQQVIQILKEVGLENFENQIASQLSGGQQQRVALARVLLSKNKILLLDEPFTGLDEKTHNEMLELVKSLCKKHKLYVIMVTHNYNDCKKIANKIYKMQDDKLVLKS